MNFKTLIIKYEDLRDNTFEEFKKIINFIEDLKGTNNEINEEKLENSINSTSFSKLKNKDHIDPCLNIFLLHLVCEKKQLA